MEKMSEECFSVLHQTFFSDFTTASMMLFTFIVNGFSGFLWKINKSLYFWVSIHRLSILRGIFQFLLSHLKLLFQSVSNSASINAAGTMFHCIYPKYTAISGSSFVSIRNSQLVPWFGCLIFCARNFIEINSNSCTPLSKVLDTLYNIGYNIRSAIEFGETDYIISLIRVTW